MNNLFCIRIKSSAGPSSGIYIKTNVPDYDLVLLSYHSIINNDKNEEKYNVFYYDGSYEEIKVRKDKKFEEEDLIIAKVEKLENKFRDKIENIFLEDSKEGELLNIKGFPEKLLSSNVPFQKLDIKVNEMDVTEIFHQFKFDGKNGSLPSKDDTHGMSGSPIFKKDEKYIRLKGMYLEIRDKDNTFGMGHLLKIQKIKECLAEYCPEYDFGISETLNYKMKEILDEIKEELIEAYNLYSIEEIAWRERFDRLKEILSEKKDEIEIIVNKMTCGKYEILELLENPKELKILTRCLLSALVCNNFDINGEFFINYGNNYSYLSPSLISTNPQVQLAKVMDFISKQPSYKGKNIFVKYKVSRDNCDMCNISEDNQEQATANTTLLPREKPEHFMSFYSDTKTEIKCAGCFKNIKDTFYFERKKKWKNNK